MKHLTMLSCAAFALLLVSCGKKQQNENLDLDFEPIEITTVADPDFTESNTVTSGASTFAYTISRTASDSLPMIDDGMNHCFKDNVVKIVVTRDGAAYFDRTFTKQSFAKFLSSSDAEQSTLGGVKFNKCESGRMLFQVNISSPVGDITVPFDVTVESDGSCSVAMGELEA